MEREGGDGEKTPEVPARHRLGKTAISCLRSKEVRSLCIFVKFSGFNHGSSVKTDRSEHGDGRRSR